MHKYVDVSVWCKIYVLIATGSVYIQPFISYIYKMNEHMQNLTKFTQYGCLKAKCYLKLHKLQQIINCKRNCIIIHFFPQLQNILHSF